MKKYTKHIIAVLALFAPFFAYSQASKSTYFLESSNYRNYTNPAFGVQSKGWFGFGFSSIGIGVSSPVAYSDIFVPNRGNSLSLAFASEHGRNDFYNNLSKNNILNTDINVNILSFGFGNEKRQFRFDVNWNNNVNVSLSKDLFKLGLYLLPENSSVSIKNTAAEATSYVDIGIGMTENFNENLRIGFKLKYIMGIANARVDIKEAKFTSKATTIDDSEGKIVKGTIDVDVDAQVDGSYSFLENVDGDLLSDLDFISPVLEDFTKIPGMGVALDLGAEYRMLDDALRLSASLTDLGFISWSKQIGRANVKGSYSFSGAEYFIDTNETNFDDISDMLTDAFKLEVPFATHYTQMLPVKMNVAGEYAILENKISFGLLASGIARKNIFTYDFTGSVNFRPARFFDAAVSYSMGNTGSGLGFALSLHGGGFNLMLAGDYIPLKYTPQGIPVNAKRTNVQFGLSFNIGRRFDSEEKKNKSAYLDNQAVNMASAEASSLNMQTVKVETEQTAKNEVYDDELFKVDEPESALQESNKNEVAEAVQENSPAPEE